MKQDIYDLIKEKIYYSIKLKQYEDSNNIEKSGICLDKLYTINQELNKRLTKSEKAFFKQFKIWH